MCRCLGFICLCSVSSAAVPLSAILIQKLTNVSLPLLCLLPFSLFLTLYLFFFFLSWHFSEVSGGRRNTHGFNLSHLAGSMYSQHLRTIHSPVGQREGLMLRAFSNQQHLMRTWQILFSWDLFLYLFFISKVIFFFYS